MPPPLKGIQLSNYRNFINKKEIFNFDHTLFKGKNAVGKTNLLESISFLCPGTGFRKDVIQNFIFKKQELLDNFVVFINTESLVFLSGAILRLSLIHI